MVGLIEGVELLSIENEAHTDSRGFFREIIRKSDSAFTGFGQWSHSMMYTGTIKAWHYHKLQTDYWYVPVGVVRAVVCDITPTWAVPVDMNFDTLGYFKGDQDYKVVEYLLGDNQPAQVLKIPPGVAHGLKVLQGPAHLMYITDREYDPDDEGRIAYDALGYDWHKEDIK